MSLVLRYIVDGEIHEEFVGFTPADGLDTESSSGYIRKSLEDLGADIEKSIG